MQRRQVLAWLGATSASSLAAACGGGGSGPPSSNPTAARGEPPATSTAALQGLLDAWASAPVHMGVSAAVVRSDASLWSGASGLARTGEALRPDHQIAVGSITKTVSAALVLQLSQEGRLRLDDTVGSWLGGIRYVPPQVTLRQLMNHTCGLANYTENPAFPAAISADAARRFAPLELLELFLGPPVSAPGARTQYTNTAFVVLGLAAEAAGGHPIAAQWRERFFGPLGLREVFLPPDEPARGAVANAWVGSASATDETDPLRNVAGFSSRWAAFGLVASPRDVARWSQKLFAGGVLEPATRQQMLQFVPAAGTIPQETGSGLGVRRYLYGNREQWGHSGASPEGSSIVLHEPASGLTVAVAMNQSPATHASSHFALVGQLLAAAR
jgi:D-alanyl-D-alanine carboxypeptidase